MNWPGETTDWQCRKGLHVTLSFELGRPIFSSMTVRHLPAALQAKSFSTSQKISSALLVASMVLTRLWDS